MPWRDQASKEVCDYLRDLWDHKEADLVELRNLCRDLEGKKVKVLK